MDFIVVKDLFNVVLTGGILLFIFLLMFRKKLPKKYNHKIYLWGAVLYFLSVPYYFFLRNDPLQALITFGFGIVFYNFSTKKLQ